MTDSVFCKEADFDLADVRLKEGQELVWVTEDEADAPPWPSATTTSWRSSFPRFERARYGPSQPTMR